MTSVYVGNATWNTTTEDLQSLFGPYNPETCEIVFGRNGRSRGYGIVTFGTEDEANTAIESMNGMEVDGRSLFVRLDKGKPEPEKRAPRTKKQRAPRERKPIDDSNFTGTSIYVGNLSWDTTDELLGDAFADYNPVTFSVAQNSNGRSKGWGTVQFETTEDADAAIAGLNDTEVDGRTVFVRIDRRN